MPARFWGLNLIFFALLALAAVPLGRYLHRVFAGENRLSARVLRPVERWICRLAGVSPEREHSFQQYAVAMLAFSAVTQIISYLVMRVQAALPFNPTNHATWGQLSGVSPWLAFNTATSFSTNTNWKSYAGEATMTQ